MRSLALLGVVCSMGVTLLSCGSYLHEGNGQWVTQERQLLPFDRIKLVGHFKVLYHDHQSRHLSVSADKNLLSYIRTRVQNGELIVDTQPNARLRSSKTITLNLSNESLQEISSSGSNEIQLSNLKENWLRVHSKGGDKIALQGQVKEVLYDSSGVAHINAAQLQTEETSVKMRGAGDVIASANKALSVDLSGRAKVKYLGEPKVSSTLRGNAKVEHVV
jgi:hypothetical protein